MLQSGDQPPNVKTGVLFRENYFSRKKKDVEVSFSPIFSSKVTLLKERDTALDRISCGTVQYGGKKMAIVIGQLQGPVMVMELDKMEEGWTHYLGAKNTMGENV